MINIVICGLVRTPELFLQSLIDFADLRKQNLVDKVVFSTWEGEIDQYKNLRERITSYGVYLLENRPPFQSGTSHIWHQMKALEMGLRELPVKCDVLKTRADVYIAPKFIKMLTKNKDYLNIENPHQHSVFEKKIWIPWYEITKPFYMGDECFFGSHSDIKKLVNFDATYDVLFDIGPGISHIRRFIHPFLNHYPILGEYLQFGVQSGHFSVNRFAILKYNLESEIFLEYLATYYLILNRYFRVESCYVPNQLRFMSHSEPTITINSNQFEQNFCKANSWNPETGGHIYAYNENYLRALLNQTISGGDILNRFYSALERCETDLKSTVLIKNNEQLKNYYEKKQILLMASNEVYKEGIQKKTIKMKVTEIAIRSLKVLKRVVPSFMFF